MIDTDRPTGNPSAVNADDHPPGEPRSAPTRPRTSRPSDPSGVKILGAPDLR